MLIKSNSVSTGALDIVLLSLFELLLRLERRRGTCLVQRVAGWGWAWPEHSTLLPFDSLPLELLPSSRKGWPRGRRKRPLEQRRDVLEQLVIHSKE